MTGGVLLRALVLRWLARPRARSALAVVAVALGVAAFLASASVADTVVRSARAHVNQLSGGADLAIEADETGLPLQAAVAARSVVGVRAALPRVIGWARADGLTGSRVLVVGVDPMAEIDAVAESGGPGGADLRARPADALAFAAGRAALVASGLAETLELTVGAELTLIGPNGSLSYPVVDIVADGRMAKAAGGRVVVLALPAAQAVLGRAGRIDRVDIFLDSGSTSSSSSAPAVDPVRVTADLRAAVRAIAPRNVHVGPPRLVDSTAEDVMGTIDVAMRVGAVIALLIGVFLIHHTVAVGVAERRREIGILRAMGATRGQVLRVFAAEASVLGLTGGALGVVLAYVLARGALEGFAGAVTSAYFGTDPARVEVSPALAASGLLIGVVVALVAAWAPASQAARLPPNDSIRRGPDGSHGAGTGAVRRRFVAALVMAAAGSLLVVFPSTLGRTTGYIALLLLLIAFLAASPLVLQLAARAVSPLLTRWCGVPGRLAADDLLRHPRRAALPAAALAFGLALVIETSGTLESISNETVRWMDENVAGELFVSSGRSVMGGAGYTPLMAELGAEIARVPGVAHVVRVRFRRLPWRGTRIFVLGLDIEAYAPVWKLALRDGELADHALELTSGRGCFVSENFVLLHGLDVGDTVTLPGAAGETGFRILDVFNDYSWPRGTVLLDQPRMAEMLQDPLVDDFSVTLVPGADVAATSSAIDAALGADRDIVITSAAEMHAQARQVLADIFSLAYAQVAAALAVAFLGVLNTLWISVVLRRRELGLLRSVGATRGQIVRSIVIEAAVLGVVGAVLGLIGGAIVEWVLLRRILPADTGWAYPFHFPWATAAVVGVLAIVTSALAGWFPARAAARVPIADALGHE